ncbi:MAG: PEGA domain-containing protein [Proteobacteria bacterium]|nr:PEGA domain-containing protein [Pseudomonadota bacterium]
MIGAPIYLVSACATGEEFVAAFRRYADKGGIFIPIGEPIAANRRGRFAMTLKDGSVMIEGEAEIVASSKAPSPLYGRIGMTLKFVEPDDASKAVLTDLERARFATKPSTPSIAARAAEVPAEPRPTVPIASGRIDAANALAESVAIGDQANLKDLGPPKAGPRFVIPSIPSSPPTLGRPRTPSAFPIDSKGPPRDTSEGIPEAVPAPAPLPRPRSASVPGSMGSVSSRETQPTAVVPPPSRIEAIDQARRGSSLPTLEDLKVGQTQAVAVVPPPALFVAKNLFEESEVLDTDTRRSAPAGSGDDSGEHPPIEPPVPHTTTVHTAPPPVAAGTTVPMATPVPLVTAEMSTVSDADPDEEAPEVLAARVNAATATRPRFPVVRTIHTMPGIGVPLEAEEPTDLTEIPRQPRPNIEEPTPSGDWTMPPDGPIESRPREPSPARQANDGDWTITPDMAAPDGYDKVAAAAAVVVSPPPATRPAPRPPTKTKAFDAVDLAPPIASAEPKVQIDPTLMEPLPPMPLSAAERDELAPPTAPLAPPPFPSLSLAQPAELAMHAPQPAPTPPLGFAFPPSPAMTPMAAPFANASGSTPIYPSDPPLAGHDNTSMLQIGRRRRLFVIIGSAIAAVAIGVFVVLFVLDRGQPAAVPDAAPRRAPVVGVDAAMPITPATPATPTTPTTPAAPATPDSAGMTGSDVPTIATATGAGSGSGSAEVVAPAVVCSIDATSAPTGAEIFDHGATMGTTPRTLEYPCGTSVTLEFRKAGYPTTQRTVKLVPKGKLRVALVRPITTVAVKVTSTPSGATLIVNGRAQGATPTIIKLPLGEGSTVTFSKDGYAAEAAKITPKQANQALHVQLKKKRAR